MHRYAAGSLAAGLALVLAAATGARAQDAHYWTEQYGATAALLGGAVIGSVDGLPAVYYNPGRLGSIGEGGFALSTYAFGWETLTVDDGIRPGTDLASTRSGLDPSLIAGSLPWGGENTYFAYSFLTRRSADADIGAALIAEDLPPTVDQAYASLRLENRVRDYWTGLTWAWEPRPGLGVGISGFGALWSSNRRAEVMAEVLDATGSGVAELDVSGYEFWDFRVLAKLGVWTELAGFDLGATVTTASLDLFGSGQITGNRGTFGSGGADRMLVAVYDGLETQYRSPFSAGIGVSRSFGATRIHLSGEWFAAVDRYNPMEVQPLGPPEDPYALSVVHQADAVFDWGAGIEHAFSGKLAAYASYVTDASAAPGGDVNLGTASWDISAVTLGSRVELPWMKFTLGGGLAWGKSPFSRLVDLAGVDPGTLGDGGPPTTLRYRNWQLIFGFEL